MVCACIHVFIIMLTAITAVLHWLISGIFALLHIELHASPQTHLNLEGTGGGMNTLVIGILSIVGSAVISALLLRLLCRPSKKDRALMASAKPAVWGKISKKDLEYLRNEPYTFKRQLAISFAALTAVTVLTGILTGYAAGWMIVAGVIWALSAAAASLRVWYCRLWQRIDESAQCAVIPVYRSITKEKKKRTVRYMICYLPDGIYEFENIGKKPNPCTVHVIHYHGFYRYIPR